VVLLAAGAIADLATAQSALPEVGLVTRFSDGVRYWSPAEKKEPGPILAFMKVHKDDHFKIPTGASLQLTYFSNGRQEIWKGEVTVVADQTEGRLAEAGTLSVKPEVKYLPSRVTMTLGTTLLPLPASSIPRSGHVEVRGEPMPSAGAMTRGDMPLSEEEQKELEEARATYFTLRQQADDHDVMPELYLLSVLSEYEQYEELGRILDELLSKEPGNTTLAGLRQWVDSQSKSSKY
jgi:hypothetical protein